MSTADTVIPLLSMPWLSCGGIRLSTTPLPGLRPDVIQGLDAVYPGILSPEMRQLLHTMSARWSLLRHLIEFIAQHASHRYIEHRDQQ